MRTGLNVGRPWLLAAALSLSLIPCRPTAGQPMIELKAGISDPVNTVLAWYMARDAGLFDAQGLKVDIVDMHGGSRGAAELQAGHLDVMHVGLSSVIRVNRSGGDVRLIGSLANVIRFTFFAAPGVKAAADLKGGVIGVSTFGSESDSTVTLALQRLGLRRSDITVKEFGGGARRLAAVKAGEIKATPINEPVASLAREQGVHVLIDLVPERIPWVFSGIVVRRADIDDRRDVLIRFLRATIEGNYLALADAKRAKEVLARELKITDAKILDITYSDFKALTPLDIEPSPAGAENILAQLSGGSAKLEHYLDVTLLAALREQGFLAAMAQKNKL
jgi:ABC-type nitrate/sulfonate/bicarbonate transport system substrate-binding protein